MVKKITKYAKFAVCCTLILSLIAPSYAALSASDGSAFVTKAEFDSALADFNARLTTFEAGINSKIDSQVSSYLDRNGIWNGKSQDLMGEHTLVAAFCGWNGSAGSGSYVRIASDGVSYSGSVSTARVITAWRPQTFTCSEGFTKSGLCLLKYDFITIEPHGKSTGTAGRANVDAFELDSTLEEYETATNYLGSNPVNMWFLGSDCNNPLWACSNNSSLAYMENNMTIITLGIIVYTTATSSGSPVKEQKARLVLKDYTFPITLGYSPNFKLGGHPLMSACTYFFVSKGDILSYETLVDLSGTTAQFYDDRTQHLHGELVRFKIPIVY